MNLSKDSSQATPIHDALAEERDEEEDSSGDLDYPISLASEDMECQKPTVSGLLSYELSGTSAAAQPDINGDHTADKFFSPEEGVPVEIYTLNADTLLEVLHYLLVFFDLHGYGLSLECCSLQSMKSLNHRYRGSWKVTDVLSFPQLSFTPPSHREDFELRHHGGHAQLGDIALCFPHVLRLWQQHPRGELSEHLLWTVVHGFLHLIGYDHQEEEEARIMQHGERKILSLLHEDLAGIAHRVFKVEHRR